MKIGDMVKVKTSRIKWASDHADEVHGYPQMIRPPDIKNKFLENFFSDLGGQPSVQEQLSEYFINRYSYERKLDMDGVIVGDNGQKGNAFCFLVWIVNELGEDLTYLEPSVLEKL